MTAWKGHLPRPGIAGLHGTLDEQDLGTDAPFAQDDRDGGLARLWVGNSGIAAVDG